MPSDSAAVWSDEYVAVFKRYDEGLIRAIAARLAKPRNQWPPEELIDRCVETLNNPITLDRRLADLTPAARKLLAMFAHSRQLRWSLGNAVELLMSLGVEDGLAVVKELFDIGLVLPVLTPIPEGITGRPSKIATFAHWIGTAGPGAVLEIFAPEPAAVRCLGTDLELPDLSDRPEAAVSSFTLAPTQEADGLEFLLRLGVLWQQASSSAFRRTQQGDFFKRDAERLSQDPQLTGPAPDQQIALSDVGFLLAEVAELQGVLAPAEGELRVGRLPPTWADGLPAALSTLLASIFRVARWSPQDGWRTEESRGNNPFASANLLALLLLARLPAETWLDPKHLETWITASHPYWAGETARPSRSKPWLEPFLFGVAFPLKLVQVRVVDEVKHVRLAPTGRALLSVGEKLTPPPAFPKTLAVQPNLEIIAYRQGLTPSLVERLTRLAAWKTLGAACLLQLEPGTVYRALEAGETFESLTQLLQQHTSRPVPATVLDSLRTWASKRDRITIYPTAALLEFNSAAELNEALSRGLPAVRLGDTLAVVPREESIEFKHFRLAGTRDYARPAERCVTVDADGVTLTVDVAQSDLMLETELPRFADLVERNVIAGRRVFRLTPASLARARGQNMSVAQLDVWFQQRCGQTISPAARLLLAGAQSAAPKMLRHLVLHVESEELADGLLQWPPTRALVADRLGPTALAVAEESLAALTAQLADLGIVPQVGDAPLS